MAETLVRLASWVSQQKTLLLTQTLSFDQIMKNANRTFGGATTKNATTAAGKMQRLKVQLAEAGEQIGTALLPVLAQRASGSGRLLTGFRGWMVLNELGLLGSG